MDSSRDSEFDARLAKIEATIVVLQRSLEALIAEGRPADSHERAASSRASSFPNAPPAPRRRQNASDEIGAGLSSWFASRSAEWWLSRVGIGFVILAILMLYGYAIDHGWITPPIRVFAGNRQRHALETCFVTRLIVDQLALEAAAL